MPVGGSQTRSASGSTRAAKTRSRRTLISWDARSVRGIGGSYGAGATVPTTGMYTGGTMTSSNVPVTFTARDVLPGEIRQLGYVVDDIERAMAHWITVLGM